MIKAIIFDCFGVLTSDNWQEFLDGLPEGTDIEAVRQVHREYDAGRITKQQCSESIKGLTGRSFTEIDDMFQSDIPKNQKLLKYIKTLRPKHKIAIASNVAGNWVRDSFLTEDEQKLFDKMFFSYEMGVIKPDPGFFIIIFNELDVAPRQVVLVDDKERYCQAAIKQGMKAILYKNFEQMQGNLEELLTSKA